MMGYGYENAAGDRISALIDMINGGGPGRSGDTFEGGGILSLLANAVAKPYGSVRERPGHTPMGAAAPTPMEVIRPIPTEPVDAAVLPDITIPPYTLALQGERPLPEATSGRTFTEEDFAVLGRLHPEVAKLFSGVRVGDPLSRQQAMFLDAASIDSFAGPVLSFGDTTEEFRNPSFDLTAEEFTENLASAPLSDAALQLAPPVSPRPRSRPDVLGSKPAGIPAAQPAAETAEEFTENSALDAAAPTPAGATLVTDEDGFDYYVYPGGKMIYGDNALFHGLGDEISPGSTRYNRIMAQMALRALAGTDAPTRVTDEYGKPYYLSPGGKMTYGEGHIFSDPGDEVPPSSDLYNKIMTRIALEGLAR